MTGGTRILKKFYFTSSPKIRSEDQMESSNVKEKQAKLQFLEKLIFFLENELSRSINVKPMKIVSGQEPEMTCYMLQIFTVLATHKPSPLLSVSAEQKDESSSKEMCHSRDESTSHSESKEMQKISPPESEVELTDNDFNSSSKLTPIDVFSEVSSVKIDKIEKPFNPEDTEASIVNQKTDDPPYEPEYVTDDEEDIPGVNRTPIRITARRGPPRKKEKMDEHADYFHRKDRAQYSIIDDEEKSPSLEIRDEGWRCTKEQSFAFVGTAKDNDSDMNLHTAIVQKIVDEQEHVERNDDE